MTTQQKLEALKQLTQGNLPIKEAVWEATFGIYRKFGSDELVLTESEFKEYTANHPNEKVTLLIFDVERYRDELLTPLLEKYPFMRRKLEDENAGKR